MDQSTLLPIGYRLQLNIDFVWHQRIYYIFFSIIKFSKVRGSVGENAMVEVIQCNKSLSGLEGRTKADCPRT